MATSHLVFRGQARNEERGPRHLFDCWPEVGELLGAASQIALFLDFDGTLAYIRRRPEEVSLGAGARQTLCRLAEHPRVKLWIISGRRRADLRRRVGVEGIRYLGLYGWEKTEASRLPNSTLELLCRTRTLVGSSLAGLEGVWLEDKHVSFAIHYRGASRSNVRCAWARLQKLSVVFEQALWIVPGKKVWEVLPREIRGKGENLRNLIALQPTDALAIFVGDDMADEDAFRVLGNALTVRVGSPRRSGARFRLDSPKEVRQFLQRLEKLS